ncbi:MAG: hydrogenase maturation protease [Candidatus Humimicrobiaceae bacterium]
MQQNKKKEIVRKIYNAGITKPKTVKVIGFGNVFMADDGIGIKIIEELEKIKFSGGLENIEIINGATSAVDLLFKLSNPDMAIIIDAIDAGQAEGEIVKFKPNEIEDVQGRTIKSFSLHDLGLEEVFRLMRSLKIFPDITIIGVKPLIIDYREKLSPEIESRIPEIILMIKQEIKKWRTTE